VTPDLQTRKRLPLKDYKYLRSKGYSDEDLTADGFEIPKLKNRTVVDDAAGAGLAAVHGATMGFADDVVGLVSPDLQDQMNRSREAFGEVHPVAEFGSELVGGALTGGAVASGLKRVGARFLPAAAQAVTNSLRGQAAITGGVAAAGAAEGDLADRAKAFAIGAPTGAVLGPVVAKVVEKAVVPAATAVGRRVADSQVGRVVQRVAERSGTSRGRTFAERMEEIAGRRQERLTPEGRANAYVARMFGRDQIGAEQLQGDIAAAQNEGALDRLQTGLERAVGRELGDYQTRYGELADEAAEGAKPFYERIRNVIIDQDQPLREVTDKAQRRALLKVRGVLQRPAGRAAYDQAKTNVLNMGEDHPSVQAWRVELDPQAGVGVQIPDGRRKAVTVGMMDDMKKVLDEQISAIEEAITSGQIKGEQLANIKGKLPGLRQTRADIVDAVDVLTNQQYAAARQTAQPLLQQREAFREGYQSPFSTEGNVLNAPNRTAQPDYFAEGYATRLAEQMRKARESQAGWRDVTSGLLDSEAARTKLGMAIPDPQLAQQIALERQIRQQANNSLVQRNSQTMPLAAGVLDATGGDVAQTMLGAAQAASAPLRTGVKLGARALWDRFGGGLNEEAAGNAGDLLTRRLAAADPRLRSLVEYYMQQEADRQAAQTFGQRMGALSSAPIARRTGGR